MEYLSSQLYKYVLFGMYTRSVRPAIGSFLEPRTVMNNMDLAANFVESPVDHKARGRTELKKQLQKLSRKMQVCTHYLFTAHNSISGPHHSH